ncbi:hypothetical protein TIFTF001_012337 [Ficus carica]|uniref:Uncharacterized protein n=1 Tax=Ficus carica TaxID=3494 RepID=A0AA87ZVS6_FICCA|nr:hypothetical protein TIFTF001_012337 [Ficus carica]
MHCRDSTDRDFRSGATAGTGDQSSHDRSYVSWICDRGGSMADLQSAAVGGRSTDWGGDGVRSEEIRSGRRCSPVAAMNLARRRRLGEEEIRMIPTRSRLNRKENEAAGGKRSSTKRSELAAEDQASRSSEEREKGWSSERRKREREQRAGNASGGEMGKREKKNAKQFLM